MLKKEMPRCRETDVLIHLLFKNNPEGFVINAEHRFEKGEIWNMARYIGRYVKHPPIEPPSVHQLSQQERMQLIIKLIIDNQNGIGASIENVVSEAVMKGIDREVVLDSIEHLKMLQNILSHSDTNQLIKIQQHELKRSHYAELCGNLLISPPQAAPPHTPGTPLIVLFHISPTSG
ncbi:MAG: hypothetical protein KKG76_14175 [Euryarchaeota archaeon]|nr:hypothetical protein [Euryarchaeota archaeon]